MKILYITNYDTMYGANTSLFWMMISLKQDYGVEPYLLVPGGGKIGQLCQKAAIPCLCYDFRISALPENTKWIGFRKLTRRFMRYTDFYRIWKTINSQDIHFDLIHSNSSIFDIGVFLAKRWKIPHVWHIREFAKEDYGLVSVLNKRTIRNQYMNSDAVIAISDAIQERIFSYSNLIPVRKIYNGIHLVEKYEKKYAKDDVINFCIIGSICRRKNQLDTVKACIKLEEKGLSNYCLYIVGDTGGDYYQEILQYIAEHPILQEKIIFTGYCDDVNQFLKDKDVGIMASDAEAFGRVTVEYMANYMPVIGTNTGGTPEVVGDAGKLYEPHNIDQLGEYMSYFICNMRVLERDGMLARKQSEFFSAEKNAESIHEIYQEVYNARKKQ